MNYRFDDFLATAAGDGAFAPIGVLTCKSQGEIDQLMRAWYIERQSNIESSLFLDQASQLLMSILHDGQITDTNRRKSRDLLRVIKESRRRKGRSRGV
jgi:hypothetical protein